MGGGVGVVAPGSGAAPPADATVLFNGGDLAGWSKREGSSAGWIVEDDVMLAERGQGPAISEEAFHNGVLIQDHVNPVRYRNRWMHRLSSSWSELGEPRHGLWGRGVLSNRAAVPFRRMADAVCRACSPGRGRNAGAEPPVCVTDYSA